MPHANGTLRTPFGIHIHTFEVTCNQNIWMFAIFAWNYDTLFSLVIFSTVLFFYLSLCLICFWFHRHFAVSFVAPLFFCVLVTMNYFEITSHRTIVHLAILIDICTKMYLFTSAGRVFLPWLTVPKYVVLVAGLQPHQYYAAR